MTATPLLQWTEDGEARAAVWRSERGAPPPARVVIADDRLAADEAYGLAAQGTGLLWRGDFHNARQLLAAMASRADRGLRQPAKSGATAPPPAAVDTFNRLRQARAQRARTLGMLLVPLDADFGVPLRRAPDVREACIEAYAPGALASVTSLRELLGIIGAHEWRRRGIEMPALGGERIHPHYAVFAPIRGEYVDLVAREPLPAALAACNMAFDIGTGTGVLAAVLARRGVGRVIATDQSPRALACARDNLARLGLAARVDVVEADLFPPGRVALVVCNPPWVPARPSAPLEQGIYDADSRMLKGFLAGLPAHLAPGGEGWLILSDLAEHLGLRARDDLLGAIASAGLAVTGRSDVRPHHPRASDPSDPLHAARRAEVTSLWRLGSAST